MLLMDNSAFGISKNNFFCVSGFEVDCRDLFYFFGKIVLRPWPQIYRVS